uniref:Centrosomal protein 95 n=1 Tax=Phasianus colchicus TaxID=9054 RepID=A0A669Q965_PHACC
MGSAEDWVEVANDLLRSCHVNQHVKRLSECGADVFVCLYESILGEKVPDFIATPRSQEDDAHNVQAVIDSLALDYLQVSLSHITGENIVKGEKESIRNLLEIFDGLLEYLTEEASESSSQNGGEKTDFHSIHSTELPKEHFSSSAQGLREPICQAVPLLPPFQPAEARSCDPVQRDHQSLNSQSAALVNIFRIEMKSSCFCFFFRYENSTIDSLEDPLSHRTTKENLSKQELHQVSQKLSRRLNELDSMLKRALGGRTREEVTDEDNLSQHSDSVMDYRRRKAERVLISKLCNLSVLPFSYLFSICFTSAPKEQEYKENIFKESPKIPQPVRVYSRKTTPWNPRYSQWIPKRGTVKPKKAAPMKVRDDDLLVKLLEEFPHLHISQHTMNKMWRQQLAQTEQLKAASGRARLKLQNEVQQALKKHELLVAIIKKDRDHNKRLQELKQRIYRQKWTQSKVREKRQQVVRARKYYEDYRVQLRAKMMRARTREERIFKNLFEEGLEIQKQRLKDLRAYAQERRAEQRREHQNELESMENYYRDQFSMLAEALSQERQEIQTREKAQAQMLQKTKRELRSRMEKEIQQLQTAIMQNDDETFFQELEADRLRSRLQMASFQYNKSGFS